MKPGDAVVEASATMPFHFRKSRCAHDRWSEGVQCRVLAARGAGELQWQPLDAVGKREVNLSEKIVELRLVHRNGVRRVHLEGRNCPALRCGLVKVLVACSKAAAGRVATAEETAAAR